MRQIKEAGGALFNYASYYGTSFSSLYSAGVTQASALYTAYTQPKTLINYRENFAQLILAGSVTMIGASFATSVSPPAFLVNLAVANTLSYSAKYVANYISSLPSDPNAPRSAYWDMFVGSLNALSDNIGILSAVMFLGSGISAGLQAAVGNHGSIITSSLGIVLARTIGFELNKMKESLFNSEDALAAVLQGKGSTLEFFKKAAVATIGVKALTSALSADFYTSLVIFATFRTFADVVLDPNTTPETFLSKLGESIHKPLLYATDFVTMSAYDITSSQFIQANSIAAAVAKAGYLESYKQVIGDNLKSTVEGLEIHATIRNLLEVTGDYINSMTAKLSSEKSSQELGK